MEPNPDDPLALARRLIDLARAEEFQGVELGPLPVLPAPGAESPLELAMQLLHSAKLEEEGQPVEPRKRDNDPLDLAIQLLGSVKKEEGDTADRLAVASQLLEVEEATRREAKVDLMPELAGLTVPEQPQVNEGEFSWLNLPPPPEDDLPWAEEAQPAPPTVPEWVPDQSVRLLKDSGRWPALPTLPPAAPQWTPPDPSVRLLEDSGRWPALPTLPPAAPQWTPDQSVRLLQDSGRWPALPTLPPTPQEPPAEPPSLPVPPDVPIPEWGAIPAPPSAPEPETPAALPLLRAVRPEAPADEPDQPRLELPREKADPAELARKLLQEAASEEKDDPMALARRLLKEVEQEEKADPFALARRLLKDVQREEKPAALMGAPIEEGSPPPLFDPAGLGSDPLLGAPSEPVAQEEEWPLETTHAPPATPPTLVPTRTEVWPPPAPETEYELETTHAPPADPPTLVPTRTEVWPPPLQEAPKAEEGPRLELERPPVGQKPIKVIDPDRLKLEKAPAPRVESTRDAGAYPKPPSVAEPSHTVHVASPLPPPTAPPQKISQQVHRPAPAPRPAPAAPALKGRAAALADRVINNDRLSQRLRKLWDRRARIEPNDVVIFTRQFSAMCSAGLQLHQALHFYAESHTESGMGPVIEDVAMKVSQGSTLSSAMRNYPSVFPEVYTGLIAGGETTGLLVSILNKLAELCERNQKLRQRVLAAITYPIVVLIVSLLCIAVFIWVVLPMFVPMFTSMGVELPWPTKVLVWISEAGQNRYVIAAAIILPILFWLLLPALRRYFANPTRRRFFDRMLLRIPYFGGLIEKVICARVLFSMSSMLDAGISFTTCLEKCEHVAGNAEMAHRLKLARMLLVEGDSAADCLSAHGVFPSGAIQMIAVGEESAHLAEMIRRVADVYDSDVQLALMDFASMLEPIILLVMGLVVGFIVLASALPTASLLQNL